MPMQILLRSYLNKMVHLSCMVFLRLRKVPVADCQAALFDLQQQSDQRQRRASAQLYLQEMTQSTFLHFGHGGGELVATVLALALRHDDALPGLVDAVHIDAIEVRLEPNFFPVFAILPHDRGRRERGGREGAVERGRRKGSSRDGSSRGCRREGSSRGVIERGSSRAVVESGRREPSSRVVRADIDGHSRDAACKTNIPSVCVTLSNFRANISGGSRMLYSSYLTAKH